MKNKSIDYLQDRFEKSLDFKQVSYIKNEENKYIYMCEKHEIELFPHFTCTYEEFLYKGLLCPHIFSCLRFCCEENGIVSDLKNVQNFFTKSFRVFEKFNIHSENE